MRIRSRTAVAIAAALGLLGTPAFAGVAHAAETTLTAQLAGVMEGDNPGDEDGSGTASIVLDPEAGTACWELSVENIEPVAQSHIHVGAEGESGDVVVPLDIDGFEGTSEGCVEEQDADTLQAIVDNPAGYYVNVHTEDFPAGAIRGQLTAAAETPDTAMATTSASGSTLTALGGLLVVAAAALGLRRMRLALARD
jgi:hypothetical protein